MLKIVAHRQRLQSRLVLLDFDTPAFIIKGVYALPAHAARAAVLRKTIPARRLCGRAMKHQRGNAMNQTSAAPHPVLGVLGGIGPMSTVYFYEMITAHTLAEKDQDHLDIVISSRATTPDRSAYILGESNDDPFSVMERDAEMLVRYGATVLAIPCNTAHYFYDRLQRSLPVPVLNMIQLTVRTAKAGGCQ